MNLTLKIHIKMNGAPTTVNEKCIATYIIIQNIRGHISFHTRARFYRRVSGFFWTRIATFLPVNKKTNVVWDLRSWSKYIFSRLLV